MWKYLTLGALAVACIIMSYIVINGHTSKSALPKVPGGYYMGPEDADVTVVEFLDYGCPYCREAHPTIMSAIKQDGKVRYIPRPLPFFDSQAALFVYAAGKQGKFMPAHDLLMRNYKEIDEAYIKELSQALSLDFEKIKADMADQKVKETIGDNILLYRDVDGKATPLFIINQSISYVPEGRMPTVEDFLSLFDRARGLE